MLGARRFPAAVNGKEEASAPGRTALPRPKWPISHTHYQNTPILLDSAVRSYLAIPRLDLRFPYPGAQDNAPDALPRRLDELQKIPEESWCPS